MATQRQKEINATKRACARDARDCADAVIDLLERRAMGWDIGPWRDDECWPMTGNRIDVTIRRNVNQAFSLSAQCAALEY